MARKKRNHSIRQISILTLAVMFLLAASVFSVSIVKVHLRSGTDLAPYVDSANVVTETTRALRGTIYDKNGAVIAQDNRTYNIYCILDPNRPALEGETVYVKDKEYTARILHDILKIDYDKILGYLNQNVYQTELGEGGRNLSKETMELIRSYEMPGIEFTDSIERVYPNGAFASNLIGFAQGDENGSLSGKMGMELYLNSYLTGTDGIRRYQVDKNGYILPGMKEETITVQNGYNVYLTLDAGIQNSLEEAMQKAVDNFDADLVWGAAMEINTGRVVAWGQYPTFDPNDLDTITEYQNVGAQMAYEPGSTMKAFIYAAAMNEGRYVGDATTDGNQFCYTSDEYNNPVRTYEDNSYGCVYNASRNMWGTVTFDQGLISSLNTVTSAIETEVIDPDTYLNYLKSFGFFKEVDTDGLQEAAGTLNYTYAADKINLSFGQGSTVTMLQLLQAYSAVCGNGDMIKPYFVESVRNSYDNSVIYQAETEVVGTPITEDTAEQMQDLMERVVTDENGTARFFTIPECGLIAKTGTAEVAINGRYEEGLYISSIMAALPADDPQVLVYFAFRARANENIHWDTSAEEIFLRKVAMSYGFASGGTPPETDTEPETYEVYQMPALQNHSVSYAQEKLNAMDADVYVLGDGNTVIDQYPVSTSTLTTGQRVFLLTDTAGFSLPDMYGWTRKDVVGLWAVTGYPFVLNGEGKVTGQSIPADTYVTKGTEIEVTFE